MRVARLSTGGALRGIMGSMSLPDGWTLERVQRVSQAAKVELIPPDRTVFLELRTGDKTEYERVNSSVVLSVGGLYLVLPDDQEDDWLMGQADDEGPIICWAYYGPLEEALLAL